ncbi:hypothetical protein T439DRAFT_355511 [Meredithblackwellia eburnea MCA 4105]
MTEDSSSSKKATVEGVPPRYSTDFGSRPAPEEKPAAVGPISLSDDQVVPPVSSIQLDHPELSAFGSANYQYKPSYEIDRKGNILSHDTVLNSSPIALLRFLEEKTSAPPTVTLSVRGIKGKRDVNKLLHTCDFSFVVRVSPDPSAIGAAYRPLLYTMGDWELACRGRNALSESADGDPRCQRPAGPDPKRTVSSHWREELLAERASRVRQGLPGFIHPASLLEVESVDPERTAQPILLDSYLVDLFDAHAPNPTSISVGPEYEELSRQRADRRDELTATVEKYCNSRSPLKELKVIKETYGYNWDAVVEGVRAKVLEAWALPEDVIGTLTINVHTDPETIIIRPNNSLSKTFSTSLFNKAILTTVLYYPMLCATELVVGARFDHFRAASPLVRWKVLPGRADGEEHTEDSALALAASLDNRQAPKVAVLPTGEWVYLVGMEEGEWLRKWEGPIQEAVKAKKRGRVLLKAPSDVAAAPALRGY